MEHIFYLFIYLFMCIFNGKFGYLSHYSENFMTWTNGEFEFDAGCVQDFCLLHSVQTGCEAQKVSFVISTEDNTREGKAAWA
jgi:hypothetical protein